VDDHYDVRLTARDAGYEFDGLTTDMGERLSNRVLTQLLSSFSEGRGSELQAQIRDSRVRTRPFLTTLITLFCQRVVDQLALFAQDARVSACELVAYRQLSSGRVLVTLRTTGGTTPVIQNLELGDGD